MIQILFELNLLNPSTLEIVVFIAFLHHLSDVIKRKQTAILSHHEKLEKFRIRQKKINLINKTNFKVVLFIIFHCTLSCQPKYMQYLLDWTNTYQQTSTQIPFKQNLGHFTKN